MGSASFVGSWMYSASSGTFYFSNVVVSYLENSCYDEEDVTFSAHCGGMREPDTSATRHFGTTKLVPKFKLNHRWSCVSSELSWVEVSRLFLGHGTRVEVS